MSSNVCIFCGLSFEEDSLFWDHMVSGSCSQTNESAQSSVAPRPLTDNKSISSISGTFAATSESSIGSSSSQSRVNGNTYNWDNKTPPPENKLISNPVQPPSPPHAPPDSTLLPLGSTKVNGATVNSLANGGFPNFPVGGTQCNRAPPQACTSKQSPPPHAPLSMPTMCSTSTSLECTPVTSTRANGFTRRTEDSPGSLAGASVSASSQSKWKCVLCSLEFVDRIAMVNHVKSPEHDAKVLLSKGPAGDSSSPKVSSPREYSDSANDYIKIIRQVIREEFPLLFRRELRNFFNAAFGDDVRDTLPNGNEFFDRTTISDIDNKVIVQQGGNYRCLACNCFITSQSCLAHHVDGKRHKAALGRAVNSRFQS